MSSQPPMDERQMRKQQIRPRFLDLAEFDDDMPDSSRRAALGSFTDWPPAATVVRKKPPTIASSNKANPSTVAAGSLSTPKPTVEEVADSHVSASKSTLPNGKAPQGPSQVQTPPQARTVRFSPDTASTSKDLSDEQERTTPKATLDFTGSIIGSIQERPVGERRTRPIGSSRPKPSGSRFVVRRRMDEDLQKHEEQRLQRLQAETAPRGQEPGTGFPEIHHRDQIEPILPPVSGKPRSVQHNEDIETVDAPQQDILATQTALAGPLTTGVSGFEPGKAASGEDDEEWLDEDGKPMSAFRKSRLLRKGMCPPSFRPKATHGSSLKANYLHAPSFKPDPTRDPGGGADIDTITAVLSNASKENDQKLRNMSADEISEEISSLESLFGKDVLDALRNRKSGGISKESGTAAAGTSSNAVQIKPKPESSASKLNWEAEEDGPLAIKRQYFPAEPEGPNPSLEWMMPQHSNRPASTELRFDFSGKVIRRGIQTDETYLSGLHHHGDDQDAPGYTFSELLHLSRSTVAAQRQLALNVLGRICERYPTFRDEDQAEAAPSNELLNKHALLLRARVISISRWLLGDRHFTVRSAALRCLTSTIRSLPSGVSPPLGAGQELRFSRFFAPSKSDIENKNDHVEASEVEISIQKDWAKTMLDSNILKLFLDKTDSVITSSWEADLSMEVLLRIASCSGSHTSEVFGTDPVRLCDFIIHLGLKVSWPPISTNGTSAGASAGRPSSLPSLTAVRLLHQGILSDRRIAESTVMSGSVDQLLRFVVTPPWKVEEDWTSSDEEGDAAVLIAYQIFDEVLQLFVSLASYGFFASVVARTWKLWQECSIWALTHLVEDHASKTSASKGAWVDDAKSAAAQRIFEILAAWTHCAMDPHELMTAHDITWTQVRDWIEAVKDASQQVNQAGAFVPASTAAPAFGALCCYIDAWLRCAMGKEPKLLPKYIDSCKVIVLHCRLPVQHHFLQVLRLFSSAPTQAVALDEAEQACGACHRYLDVSKTLLRAEQIASSQAGTDKIVTKEVNLAAFQEGLALISCSPLWQTLRSPESQASGRHVYQDTFSNFVAAVMADRSGADSNHTLELAAITRLNTNHASRVAQVVMQAVETLAGPATAHTLRPFLLECVVGSNHLPKLEKMGTLEHCDSTPLSQINSLFKAVKRSDVSNAAEKAERDTEGENEDEEDENDVDPITGSKLWKCPASGLPIRADWPLLALDDLLHSANTAVFNRPDNLEADWKASELDMVRATLQLAVAHFRALLQQFEGACANDSGPMTMEAGAMICSLPSPEQILLGVMKVFMLEKDQPDTFTDKSSTGASQQKQSGVLTGRDLFRNPTISSGLTSLMDIADELVELRQRYRSEQIMSSVTLDEWNASTYGGGMSFYQFFTDLVGLWDSVSFGDVNFARVIMTVANAGCTGGVFEGEQGVAVDFRRLVWNDYRDSLHSMPSIKAPGWLLSWTDTDVDMLEHYCRYLANAAEIISTRQSIAWQIAAHHVGAVLRSLSDENMKTSRVESILRSLVAAKGETLLRELDSSSDEDVPRLFERLMALSAQV